jgi:hypothetical protein
MFRSKKMPSPSPHDPKSPKGHSDRYALGRPRERLINHGVDTLEDEALLALILGTGLGRGEDAYVMAQRISSELGDLSQLHLKSFDELCQIKGLGPVKASRIISAFALSARLLAPEDLSISQSRPSTEREGSRLPPHLIQQQNTDRRVDWARRQWSSGGVMALAAQDDHWEEAVTLSLDHGLEDHRSIGLWLRRLLRSETERRWRVISLRHDETLSVSESEGAYLLFEGARLLSLEIEQLIVVNDERYWVVHEESK